MPLEILAGERHEDSAAFRERLFDLRLVHDLAEMRRADFLFALRDEDEVDRQLAPGGFHRVQRFEEGRLRTFLIHRAAADHDFARARLVDDRGFGRRRRPFLGIELLHVVHEIEADRLRRAGVERREDARLAIGLDAFRALKTGILQQLDHVIGAFRITAILRRDRDLA